MSNPSKAKGTAAETAVVRYLQANGFPHARRQPLAGSRDIGDVWVCPWTIAEVKVRTGPYSDADVDKWLDECEVERVNAKADECWLIVKRPGKASPEHWWMIRRDVYNKLTIQFRLGEYVAHARGPLGVTRSD